MSTRNTPPESDSNDTSTDRPGPCKRASSLVAWYMPELTGAAVSAGAATTVWAPLGAIGVALGAWIATDQVTIARDRRRHRRAIERRAERASLEPAEPTDHNKVSGEALDDSEVSATETTNGEQSDGEWPGREVSA